MFDIGWSEMAVVVVVALLVVGPKQLPEALRTVTHFTRKARRYAQEFRSGIDNIVREAELEDARKALNTVRSANPSKVLQDWVDPTGEIDEEMRDLDKAARKTGESKPASAPEASKPQASIEKPSETAESDQADGKAADAGTADAEETREASASDEPEKASGARHVKEPLSIAPASSLRPPPGEDPFKVKAPAPDDEPTASAAPKPAPKPAAKPAPAKSASEDAAEASDKSGETQDDTPAELDGRRQA